MEREECGFTNQDVHCPAQTAALAGPVLCLIEITETEELSQDT